MIRILCELTGIAMIVVLVPGDGSGVVAGPLPDAAYRKGEDMKQGTTLCEHSLPTDSRCYFCLPQLPGETVPGSVGKSIYHKERHAALRYLNENDWATHEWSDKAIKSYISGMLQERIIQEKIAPSSEEYANALPKVDDIDAQASFIGMTTDAFMTASDEEVIRKLVAVAHNAGSYHWRTREGLAVRLCLQQQKEFEEKQIAQNASTAVVKDKLRKVRDALAETSAQLCDGLILDDARVAIAVLSAIIGEMK